MKKITAFALSMVLVSSSAFAGTCNNGKKVHSVAKAEMDIVDTAVSAGSFSTLVAALKAAGLVGALKGEGPLTVFAPTDDAFAALPEGTVESLLKPENKDQLIAVLTYHVVPAKLGSAAVSHSDGAESLNGQRIPFQTSGGAVMVGGATVVKADISASNGVIHVIDKVILPSSLNIVQTASEAGAFNTLLAAATEAGIAGVLQDDGPFTVFAPTDEAFAKLPEGTVESLLKPENKDKLIGILKYHVVSGRVYSDEAISAGKAETLQGGNVHIKHEAGAVKVNDAQVVKADIDASNGVIHVIDTVILPN